MLFVRTSVRAGELTIRTRPSRVSSHRVSERFTTFFFSMAPGVQSVLHSRGGS